jgi:two-component system nitrogen regulation sensor histidine kinase NtrY
VILLVLVSLVAQRLVGLWSGMKRGQAGSKLHVRLVYIFSLLAVTPAIIMTIFSALFFHYGLQGWFSDKIHNAISQSEAFAEAYMVEHEQVIKADMLAMVTDEQPEGFRKVSADAILPAQFFRSHHF